jgi:1-aminocyclopropane-1-carboxylate deaminase
MQINISNIPLQQIDDEILRSHGVKLYVLRTDLSNKDISGNKLFKLKYNLLQAKKFKCDTLLTFGGAFSNHIAATAAAGKNFGFKTMGIIRGEKQLPLNPTLQYATECGMQLHYVPRSLYKDKILLNNYVKEQFDDEGIYFIPEGGSNELGVKGCEEITNFIPIDFDYIVVSCGTGATVSGIIRSLKNEQHAIGFQILKGDGYIRNELNKWLANDDKDNWHINEDYHFGGYAKVKQELITFVNDFEKTHNIPLDFVYTAKMMFGTYDLIKTGFFARGKTIVFVHTGGIQGNAGLIFRNVN